MTDTHQHNLREIEEATTRLREDSDIFVDEALRDRKKFVVEVILFVFIISAIAIAYTMVDFEKLNPVTLRLWVSSFGIWSSLVFLAMNILFTILLLPGSFFSFSAGALFGFWWGFTLVLIGEIIGSGIAFIFGRYFGNIIKRRINVPQSGPVKTLNHYIDKHGILTVIALRIVPIVPYIFLNYLAGATKLRFVDYVAGTAIGLSVWIAIYVYLGDQLVHIDTRWLWAIWLFVAFYALGSLVYRRYKGQKKLKC